MRIHLRAGCTYARVSVHEHEHEGVSVSEREHEHERAYVRAYTSQE